MTQNTLLKTRSKMEELQRKSRKDQEANHDRDKTPLAEKLANQIIDSVRDVQNNSNMKPPTTPTVVRRSSSGTSTNSSHSDRGSKYSLGNLLKRSSYVQTNPHSPVQSRIAKKIERQTSSKEILPKNSKESSEAKKAAFTRERSKTGLNLFGGRRRSIAITDEDYESIRAAKSYHDLRVTLEGEPIKAVKEEPTKVRKNFNERQCFSFAIS